MKPYTWRAAILKSNLMPTTRHVLLTLSCYVNDAGQSAYPSTLTLASDTGLSERAVITHLHAARDAGWIKISKHGFGGQKWAHNEYFPTSPELDYDEPPAKKGTEPRSVTAKKALNVKPKALNLTTEGTEPNDKKALKEVQSNYPIELSSELSSKHKSKTAAPKQDGYSEEFESAWSAYPSRPGASKKGALKAWNARLKAGATAEEIIQGVQRYANYAMELKTEPRFIKQPATFFGPDEHYLADWTVPQQRASPAGYESAKDRSRREASEQLTGRKQNEQRNQLKDIN